MPRKPSFDRDELIVKAKDVFWSKGWAGTSMKDLEKVLNLRPGSFYSAFGSKEALCELALDRYAQDALERLDGLARSLAPLEALQALPRLVLDPPQGEARSCMLAKTFMELQAQDSPLAIRAESHLTRIEERLVNLFRASQERGEISLARTPEHLARRYQSDLIGMRAMAARPGIDPAAMAEDMVAGLEELRVS